MNIKKFSFSEDNEIDWLIRAKYLVYSSFANTRKITLEKFNYYNAISNK